jgi:putative ABC transport system substrate-binding protein
MKRRDFITLLAAAAAWPLSVRAQQKLPVIGWLSSGSAEGFAEELAAFRRALEENGYVEGRNVGIEYRWAEGHYDRLSALAADLIDRKVAVIAAVGGNTGYAAKTLTTTIPIVFVTGGDPVAGGAVATLAHPGGNLSGVTFMAGELTPKKLELLHEALPGTSTIAALINSRARDPEARSLQQAARSLGLQLDILHAGTEQEIESAFNDLARLRAGGLLIGPDPFFTDQIKKFATLSSRHAIPAIYDFRDFTAAGGLMSYGASIKEACRLAGTYTAPKWGKAGRPALSAVHQGRADHQPQDRQGARHHLSAYAARSRGRGDRIIVPFVAVHESGHGPLRLRPSVRFRSTPDGRATYWTNPAWFPFRPTCATRPRGLRWRSMMGASVFVGGDPRGRPPPPVTAHRRRLRRRAS